ncbi:MAG: glycosyltransferase, partial [Deltaproteobacteria bacterium]|nr:glycosyltransferase [Deltaproteobacteria bacterium]
TRELALQLTRHDQRLRLLYHDPNRGKGYAVRRGMLAARGAEVLFLDADLSTPLSDLQLLRRAMAEHGADVAIGSRAVACSLLVQRQPWPREMLGRLGNLAVRLLTPSLRGINDTQCGFKLFRHEAAQRTFAAGRIDRWGFDFEILALAMAMGLKVVEVGVSWRHDPHSKVRPGDYLRTLGELLHVRARLLARRQAGVGR